MRGGALFAGDVYEISFFQGADGCGDRRLIGQGTLGRDPASTTIAAGKPITLEVYVGSRLTVMANLQSPTPRQAFCRLRVTFSPEEGKSYLAVARGNAGHSSCGGMLWDVSQADSPIVPAGALNRMGKGQGCLPLEASKPLSATQVDGSAAGDAVLDPNATAAPLRNLIRP
jgi:hypothetical protein